MTTVQRVKSYNGMHLIDLVKTTSPVITEIAVNSDKVKVSEPLFLQTHKDGYKYSSEVFLNGFSLTPIQWESRSVNSKYPFRYDHYFSSLREAYEFFKEGYWKLDALLKGVPI